MTSNITEDTPPPTSSPKFDHTPARAGKERELAEVDRKLDKLIDALADGVRAPRLQQRLDELEGKRCCQRTWAG